MERKVLVATFIEVLRKGEFRELKHNSVEMLGLSMVWVNEKDLCGASDCDWCDKIRNYVELNTKTRSV